MIVVGGSNLFWLKPERGIAFSLWLSDINDKFIRLDQHIHKMPQMSSNQYIHKTPMEIQSHEILKISHYVYCLYDWDTHI
jgi:site-specific DNA-adenine methylase